MPTRGRLAKSLVCLAAACALAAPTGQAAIKNWAAANISADVTTNMALGASWTPTGVPGNGDDAFLVWSAGGNNRTQTLTNSPANVFIADSLSITNHGGSGGNGSSAVVTFSGAAFFTNGVGRIIFGGITTGAGHLSVQFSSNVTFKTLTMTGAGGSGVGTLTLAGASQGDGIVFNGGTGNSNLRISGPLGLTGEFVATNINATSAGTISGNSTVARLLLNNTANARFTISGHTVITGSVASVAGGFTLAGGGTLSLGGSGGLVISNVAPLISGTLNVSNQTLTAKTDWANSGTVLLAGGFVVGNNLTNNAAGVVMGFGAISNLVVNSGAISSTNGTLTLTSAPVQNGAVNVAAASTLHVVPDWSNNGSVNMAGGVMAGGALTNLATRTLTGFGTISNLLINASLLSATNGTLTLVAAPAIQAGSGIRVAHNGVLNVMPAWTNSGTITIASGGRITGGTLTNQAGASISGSGVIDSLLVNQGRMNFGGTISNNFLQTAGSFTLSGDATITGNATINGGAVNLLGNRLTSALLLVGPSGSLSNTTTAATIAGGVTNAGTVFFANDVYVTGRVTNTGVWTHRGHISNEVHNAGVMTLLKNAINARVVGGIVNTGLLIFDTNAFPTVQGSVTNSGSIHFSGTITANYVQNAGGSLTVSALSTNNLISGTASITAGNFDLNGRTIAVGQMAVTGAGVLTNAVAGATFNGPISNANLIAVTADTFFGGAITNTGAFFFRGAISNNLVSSGTVRLNDNATITGSATITAGSFDLNGRTLSNGLMTVNSPAVLTNAVAGASLRGALVLDAASLVGATVTNAGALRGSGTITPLLINAAGASLLASNGTLHLLDGFTQNGTAGALAGGKLSVATDWSNNGSLSMQGGVLVGGNVTNLATRNVVGFGTLSNTLVNLGVVTASGGTLTLVSTPVQNGTLSIASSGILAVPHAWLNAGVLTGAPTATLVGGTLTNAAGGTITGGGFINPLVVNQGRMDFGGTISNDFLMTAGSFTLSGDATITGTATISGGTFNLLGSGLTNGLLVITSGGTLLNSAKPFVRDAAIEGAVTNAGTVLITRDAFVNGVAFNTGTWTMRGTFSNDVFNSGTMTVLKDQDDPRFIRGIVNSGSLIFGVFAGAAPGVQVAGSVTNSGFFSANGTISGHYVQTAGSLAITNVGTLNIAGAASISGGSFDLNGRTSSNGLMIVSGGGVLTNAIGGANLLGGLSNAATVVALADTFFKGVVTNTGAFRFQGVVSNNFANAGTVTMNNNATITGVLANSALFGVTNGTLRLLVAPSQNGTVTIANASSLNVTPAWANSGSVLINGGFIAGGNTTNAATGQITGFGTISSLLVNLGTVTVTNGTLRLATAPAQTGVVVVSSSATLDVAGPWVNNGTLSMRGGTVVNNPLNNSGTIVGYGTLSMALSNPGYVLATNGTLRIQALTGNQASGTIEVSAGATLEANGLTPWLNDGRVILTGGTVIGGNISNKAARLITGSGTVAAQTINSGTILAGSTSLPLTFGNTLVNLSGGIVTANIARLVVNGAFTNSGTFTMIHGVGTFNGSVVNAGAWITDPTTNVFNDTMTVTASGYIAMTNGDVFVFTHTNGASAAASFVNLSTNRTEYDTVGGKFLFSNALGLTQNLYTAGHDLGPPSTDPTNAIHVSGVTNLNQLAGFSNNFALGTLEIANFTTVRVWDAFIGEPGLGTNDGLKAALYLNDLVMHAHSLLIISSNVEVYFVTSNSWGAANFALLGSGELHQLQLLVVPEPSALLLWYVGLATAIAARRRKTTSLARRHTPASEQVGLRAPHRRQVSPPARRRTRQPARGTRRSRWPNRKWTQMFKHPIC